MERLERSPGEWLAYVRHAGLGPEVLFLGGFASDMTGTKALRLEAHCRARNQAFTRFDYRGHGASSGRFADGTIGGWTEDAIAVVDHVVEGPVVLVGSSMGGWIMLLVAMARPERIKGLIGIAAAPDFTERLISKALTPAEALTIERDGVFYRPSAYGDPLPITRQLIDEGRDHLVLAEPLPIGCPVHLLHGQADPDVPYALSLELAQALQSRSVTVELIKDGDHRLSREVDLRRLTAALDRMLEALAD